MGLNPCKTTNVLLLPIVLALVSSSLIIDEGLRSAVAKAFHELNYSTVILSLSPNQLAFIPVVLGAFLLSLKLGGRWLSQNRELVTRILALVMVLMLASQPILLSSALPSHEREDNTSTLEIGAEKNPRAHRGFQRNRMLSLPHIRNPRYSRTMECKQTCFIWGIL